jgi:hypothetical protein
MEKMKKIGRSGVARVNQGMTCRLKPFILPKPERDPAILGSDQRSMSFWILLQ